MDIVEYEGHRLQVIPTKGNWIVEIVGTDQRTMPFTDRDAAVREAQRIVDTNHRNVPPA